MFCRFTTGAVKGDFWENQKKKKKKPCLRGKECSDCAETRLPSIYKFSTYRCRMGRRSF